MYYMKYWCQKVSDAEISISCCNDVLSNRSNELTEYELKSLQKEKEASELLVKEFP